LGFRHRYLVAQQPRGDAAPPGSSESLVERRTDVNLVGVPSKSQITIGVAGVSREVSCRAVLLAACDGPAACDGEVPPPRRRGTNSLFGVGDPMDAATNGAGH